MSDIQLQISGKQIDTVPIINLLRQGENNADTILMQLPPRYGDIALDGLTYIMYGDSKGGKSGTRVSQTLEKEINGEGVLLRWKISDDFTAVAGELKLMLKGFLPDGDPIIKWVGGTINVYCDPAGGLYPPPVSEIEQALKEMYAVLGQAQKVASHPPVIGSNGNWELYDKATGKYVDSGKPSRGEQGPQGNPGPQGIQGEQGKPGKDGLGLPVPTEQDAGKVPMVDAAGTGYELGEVNSGGSVDAYTKAESDKRYMPLAAGIKPIKSGEFVTLNDSADFALQGLKIYGKSTQDGVPTPENPIPIVSVGEDGSVTLTISDTAEQKQIFPIPTPSGLPGIPVKSGGNYTDSKGQQWVCDEVDFARGKWVQRIQKFVFSESEYSQKEPSGYGFKVFISGEGTQNAISEFGKIINVGIGNYGEIRIQDSGWTILFDPDFTHWVDVAAFKKWAADRLTIYYALAAPIEHDLTPDLIAKFEQLHTYYPTTNLFASDNAGVEMRYLADTKLYIDNKLQSLVAQYHANQAATLSLMPLETQATMIENDTDNILSQEGI